MDRLRGLDWMMLAAEAATYMHMSDVAVLDPSDAPGFNYETFRSFVCERMSRVPRLRRRLRDVPLGLDMPILVNDPLFDPRAHVHRIGVPAPGGSREVAEVVAALLPVKLDRRRPLWEVWYLEGIANGRVGYLTKLHHALFDGVTAVAMSQALFDTDPNPAPPPSSAETPPAEPMRSNAELFAAGVVHLATTPLRAALLGVQSVRQLATLARLTWQRDAPPLVLRPPRTPWNARTGSRMAWAFGDLPLSELKALGSSLGVSVNDAVCAIVGGALRAYLLKESALPQRPVVAAVPTSPRLGQQQGTGTDVAVMMLSLGTDIEDPVERVLAIQKAAGPGKARALAARRHHVVGIMDVVSPAIVGPLVSRVADLPLVGVAVNTVISNTPGWTEPLYCAGARVEAMLPCGIAGGGLGLNVFVCSYLDRLEFGIPTDADLVPDPWSIVELMKDEFRELRDSAPSSTRPRAPRIAHQGTRDRRGAERSSTSVSGRASRPGRRTRGSVKPVPGDSEGRG